MKTVLITGATGYVGHHLVRTCLDQGYRVVACARTPETLEALAAQHAGRELTTQPLDVTDAAATHDAVMRFQPDVIVHAAAYPRRKAADNAGAGLPFEQTPLYRLNVGGMVNVARAAIDLGKPVHLSIISSGAAFDQSLDHVTEDSPREMQEPFARSKNIGEQEVENIVSGTANLSTSVLYAPVILDEQQAKGLIPFAASRALRGEAIENNAPPGAGMNFLLPEDFGRAVMAITEKQTEPFVRYPINGYRISTQELLEKIAASAAKRTHHVVPVRPGTGQARGMPQADETMLRRLPGGDFSWQPIEPTMERIVNNQPLPAAEQAQPADQPVDIMAAIKEAYPKATPAEIKKAVADPAFLAQAYGKMPGYSTLKAPQLHDVKTVTVGSLVLCYGYDTSARGKREPLLVIARRGDKGAGGEDRFGVLGGYLDLGSETTAGEQPKQGVIRELGEELCNDRGEAVLKPAPERLDMLCSGIDYGKPGLPVCYHGHTLKLDAQELATVRLHAERMENDPAYRQAVQQQTHGEVRDIYVMPISQVVAMPRESFTHPHEYDAVAMLAHRVRLEQKYLSAQQP